MKNEIFGPALVVRSYERIEDVLADIASRPHPLALYYFGEDAAEQAYVLGHTLSGGVCINEALMHGGMEDAPFGGIGGSGMGYYHGREGFIQFSHVRTVFKAGSLDPRKEWGVLPPYPQWLESVLESNLTP
jgi:coniferyl-aldehyde dehydrogenase